MTNDRRQDPRPRSAARSGALAYERGRFELDEALAAIDAADMLAAASMSAKCQSQSFAICILTHLKCKILVLFDRGVRPAWRQHDVGGTPDENQSDCTDSRRRYGTNRSGHRPTNDRHAGLA